MLKPTSASTWLAVALALAASTCSYQLHHEHEGVGPFGQRLIAEQTVMAIGEAPAKVQLYDGDQLGSWRLDAVVGLTCDGMAISHEPFRHQCDQLKEHMRGLVAGSAPPDSSSVHPALCVSSGGGGGEEPASFLVLGDSHTRVWRLAAARTGVRFTVVEAMGATLAGVPSNRSKSGARQLFEERLRIDGVPRHSHLLVMLGEVDVGSAAFFKAARTARDATRAAAEEEAVAAGVAAADAVETAWEVDALDATAQVKASARRLFTWLPGAATAAGFSPGSVIVLGPTLPSEREPWLAAAAAAGGGVVNSVALERSGVRLSRRERSRLTRALARELARLAVEHGMRFADITAATSQPGAEEGGKEEEEEEEGGEAEEPEEGALVAGSTSSSSSFSSGGVNDNDGSGGGGGGGDGRGGGGRGGENVARGLGRGLGRGEVRDEFLNRHLRHDIHLDAPRTCTLWLHALAAAVEGRWCPPRPLTLDDDDDDDDEEEEVEGSRRRDRPDHGDRGADRDSGGNGGSGVKGTGTAGGTGAGNAAPTGEESVPYFSNGRGEYHDRFVLKEGSDEL